MAKRGRPTDNPKDTSIKIRLDNETLRMLNECTEMFYPNRSEVIRQGIGMVYKELKRISSYNFEEE